MHFGAIDFHTWISSQGRLVIPLCLTVWIAWGDLRTHRIPNYLTLTTALTGLTYNLVFHGWTGLSQGFLGLLLGFGFLILPYLWGGMGAGDVKALAALGAWLGPVQTLHLCCYMGIAGGLIAVGILGWQGLLWGKIRQGRMMTLNFVLCRAGRAELLNPPAWATSRENKGFPYGVAIALGMLALLIIGV